LLKKSPQRLTTPSAMQLQRQEDAMLVRVLVADEQQANFFDTSSPRAPLTASGSFASPVAGLKDRDLETDKPGRGFNGGAPGRHAMDGERSTLQHRKAQFARDVAHAVDLGRIRNEFDRLVIIAGPKILGMLREALPAGCRAVVAAEIPKDLAHHDADAIRAAVPVDVFFH
jgi:protein required for attachment to host cells